MPAGEDSVPFLYRAYVSDGVGCTPWALQVKAPSPASFVTISCVQYGSHSCHRRAI